MWTSSPGAAGLAGARRRTGRRLLPREAGRGRVDGAPSPHAGSRRSTSRRSARRRWSTRPSTPALAVGRSVHCVHDPGQPARARPARPLSRQDRSLGPAKPVGQGPPDRREPLAIASTASSSSTRSVSACSCWPPPSGTTGSTRTAGPQSSSRPLPSNGAGRNPIRESGRSAGFLVSFAPLQRGDREAAAQVVRADPGLVRAARAVHRGVRRPERQLRGNPSSTACDHHHAGRHNGGRGTRLPAAETSATPVHRPRTHRVEWPALRRPVAADWDSGTLDRNTAATTGTTTDPPPRRLTPMATDSGDAVEDRAIRGPGIEGVGAGRVYGVRLVAADGVRSTGRLPSRLSHDPSTLSCAMSTRRKARSLAGLSVSRKMISSRGRSRVLP